jgi:hypothetical protein
MKTKMPLQETDLVELNASESAKLNGGIIWAPVAIGVAILLSAVNDFNDIRQGLVDGFYGTPRY